MLRPTRTTIKVRKYLITAINAHTMTIYEHPHYNIGCCCLAVVTKVNNATADTTTEIHHSPDCNKLI